MHWKVYALAGLLLFACCLPPNLLAGSQEASRATVAFAFVEASSDARITFEHLKPGDAVRGKVAHDIFLGNRLIIPEGSSISLKVSRLERRRRENSDLLPWPVRYFRSKYAKVPRFEFAEITLAGGARVQLPVVVVFATREVRFSPPTNDKLKTEGTPASSSAKAGKRPGSRSGLCLEIVVEPESALTSAGASAADAFLPRHRTAPQNVKTVDVGTEAKLALLGTLSTSQSQAGESFKALLVEPMRLNSDLMLPEGTVFEGRVVKSTPARRLGRPGSLHLTFDRLILPAGSSIPISASLAGVGVDQKSALEMSAEGGLTGRGHGKKRLLIELGIGAGISKVADDTYQLIAEAVVSTATDASTAGTARPIGFAFSGVYWLTRRGRDVTLPPYTTFTIRFDRPPALPPSVLAPYDVAPQGFLSPRVK